MVRSLIIFFLLILPLNTSSAYLHQWRDDNHVRIEIDKSEHLLYVMLGDTIIERFRISLGRGGLGDKLMRGDNVTPLGEYRIIKFNPRSKYEYFIGINYPNTEDADRGLMNGIIGFTEYVRIKKSLRENKTPPQNTRLGGHIGIHGPKPGLSPTLEALQSVMDWTQGCIALSKESLINLLRYCTIGTKVLIRE
jgi:murein L,D-transpeptidase YafK